jgi:hypothetical protein
MVIFCSLFYYFGELVNWAVWDSLRNDFFYGVHDIHRLLFLAPIIYAGYTARIKGAIILTLVAFVIFLPRAFFISPYPDPFLRMLLFTIVAGAIGILVGVIRNEMERSRRLDLVIREERDKLLAILDKTTDGVMMIGPDYRIRFMSTKMVERFGDCRGQLCYQAISHRDTPCQGGCRLSEQSVNGDTVKWQCQLTSSYEYEPLTTTYINNDGAICQLYVLQEIAKAKKSVN